MQENIIGITSCQFLPQAFTHQQKNPITSSRPQIFNFARDVDMESPRFTETTIHSNFHGELAKLQAVEK